MINKASYELNWIQNVSSKLGKRDDPKLLEKVIYAFTLLEQLSTHNLDFIFKGGTSLLLSTSPPRRFSIDIDIVTEATQGQLRSLLDRIVSAGIFTRWEDDSNRKNANEAPIAHFKLFYKSKVDAYKPEEPVLLDVLSAANPYHSVREYPVAHEWLITEGDVSIVRIPVFESLLGDKLTAFAPNTTGILYKKNRPVEIIKQLYDIDHLFDLSADFELVKRSYIKIVHEEIVCRRLNIIWQEVLRDTKQTCHILTQRNHTKKEFIHLQTGIINITNFIVDRFKIEETITASAKTAYLCKLLESDTREPERFKSPDQLVELMITNAEHTKLNKLKKVNPEAFYYWHKTLEE